MRPLHHCKHVGVKMRQRGFQLIFLGHLVDLNKRPVGTELNAARGRSTSRFLGGLGPGPGSDPGRSACCCSAPQLASLKNLGERGGGGGAKTALGVFSGALSFSVSTGMTNAD